MEASGRWESRWDRMFCKATAEVANAAGRPAGGEARRGRRRDLNMPSGFLSLNAITAGSESAALAANRPVAACVLAAARASRCDLRRSDQGARGALSPETARRTQSKTGKHSAHGACGVARAGLQQGAMLAVEPTQRRQRKAPCEFGHGVTRFWSEGRYTNFWDRPVFITVVEFLNFV